MFFFELTGFRKARIWFDKFEQLSSLDSLLKSRTYSSTPIKERKSRTLILELMIPRGGRIEYGLLGVDYDYSGSSSLTTKVRFENKQHSQLFKDSLMKGVEPIYVGLPEEYSEDVLLGVDSRIKEISSSLNGTLDFRYAAYGLVSSTGVLYKKLARIILRLLIIPEEQVNKQLILNLLDEE
jgi:hypothetical protein